MSCNRIDNHVELALDKLISQYRCAENLQAFIIAITEEIQTLEDTFQCFFDRLNISAASGNGLDQIGTIVGQERLGLDDDFYRILLLVKIGENTSFGEPEKVIQIFKLITQAQQVFIQEEFDGEISLYGDGQINPVTVNFLYQTIQRVVGAGVRVNYIGEWDEDCFFAFDGTPAETNNGGFGTVLDANFGGCLAFIYQRNVPFAFFGGDESTEGFSTVLDSILGGNLEGV